MKTLIDIVMIVISLSILNVWIIRFGKSTPWRGGSSANMTEEFKTYGLSKGFMWLIGFLKVTLALLLLVSIWVPSLRVFSAGGILILMLGAVIMHIKIQDPFKKSIPALTFLALSAVVIAHSLWFA